MLDINQIVADLRRAGTDTVSVEAKSAAGGLPKSLATTISAFANLPGGGVILLGLDERSNFSTVAIEDRATVSAGLVSVGRLGVEPPVRIQVDEVEFEGNTVLVGVVAEMDTSAKPCRVVGNGKAYMRLGDGDYQMSAIEEEGFIVGRTRPRFDEAPVAGATIDDLDAELVRAFAIQARADDRRLRLFDDHELLIKTGVTTREGVPTVAGLITLGEYPQQFLPAFSIRAALMPVGTAHGQVRVLDEATFGGPIPFMLDEAVAWVRRNSRNEIVDNSATGRVTNRLVPPTLAVRELIANAMVHRDLAPWSAGRAIEIRMSNERFRITSPGGLYGVDVGSLGSIELTSARNRRVVDICKRLRTDDGRVVEALATGIPIVFEEVATADLRPPQFFDNGLSFTATITTDRQPQPATSPPVLPPPTISPALRAVMDRLRQGPAELDAIVRDLAIPKAAASKRVQKLVNLGFVTADGGRGILTTYRLTQLN